MEPAKKAERQPGPHTWRPDADTPGRSFGRTLRRIMADERPGIALARDITLVVGFLVIVLGGLWAYTGQPLPGTSPVVVVESGSMMHPGAPFGHVGTIDPGDLVLVKAVDGADDIDTAFGDGDRTGYGGLGDVIIYRKYGNALEAPIIHRAMTWVEVTPSGTEAETGQPTFTYSYHDERGVLLTDQSAVTLPTLRVHNLRPTESGFVTKGDNPRTNMAADQVTHTSGLLIQPDWIIGKARGEIPWLGLVKLAMTGNPTPVEFPGEPQPQVLKAWAPTDMWIMLGLSFAVVILVPLSLDRLVKRNDRLRRWLT